MVNDILLFLSADTLLSRGVFKNPLIKTFIFFGGMICPLVDFVANFYSSSPVSDYNRMVENSSISREFFTVAGNTLLLLAVWRIIEHGQHIFIKDKKRQKNPFHFKFLPFSGYTPIGITLAGQF